MSQLHTIFCRIDEADSVQDILVPLSKDILAMLHAERLTIYRREPNGTAVVSWFRSDSDPGVIRLPMNSASVVGYVALTKHPVRLANAYSEAELAEIDPKLRMDAAEGQASDFQTGAMVVVPITCNRTLLGVLQIVNQPTGGPFTLNDQTCAQEVATLLGQKFRFELNNSAGPFDYLVTTGRLSAATLAELERQAADQGVWLYRLVRRSAKIDFDELAASLEHFYLVPFMGYEATTQPDSRLLEALDRSYLARNMWCPFRKPNGQLIILIDDPNDAERLLGIQHVCATDDVELRVGFAEDILHYLGVAIPEDMRTLALNDLVEKLDHNSLTLVAAADPDAPDAELLDVNDSTIINLVNRLIQDAIENDCSDLHLQPMRSPEPAQVRLRIDGVCRTTLEIPATHYRAVVARIKILASLDITERRKPQDGKLTVTLRGQPIELRIATMPTVHGESVAGRLLGHATALPLDRLNLLPQTQATLLRLMARPHGMFLVVGPTGSGKTTTLHAMLGHLNNPDVIIVTAEDPVEITQTGMQQMQVQPRIGLTFAMAVRSFLRHDPDIILIGEMRDRETASAVLEASLTGHLVFSTLHTNSAPATVVRLLDMGLDPLNFADTLVGVLAQRLVRALCRKCKRPYEPTQEELDVLITAYGEEHRAELLQLDRQFHRAAGCEYCGGTGYRGRTAIHELLEATPEVALQITRLAKTEDIRRLAAQQGMLSLRQDGIRKIFRGDTDLAQVRGVTVWE